MFTGSIRPRTAWRSASSSRSIATCSRGTARSRAGILTAYERYDYGTIFQALNAFATVDLSALYVDISKDRLYTFAANSRERRSAQTAMYVIADGLTRLMAPILSFTADEIWRFLPGQREESVHMALFPTPAELNVYADRAILDEWNALVGIRQRVLAEIEPLRTGKQIGSSLQAKVVLTAMNGDLPLLERHADDLPMLFIVSDVEIRASQGGSQAGDAPQIAIERAAGVKCERCWRYVAAVSHEPEWAGLCERCHGFLKG